MLAGITPNPAAIIKDKIIPIIVNLLFANISNPVNHFVGISISLMHTKDHIKAVMLYYESANSNI